MTAMIFLSTITKNIFSNGSMIIGLPLCQKIAWKFLDYLQIIFLIDMSKPTYKWNSDRSRGCEIHASSDNTFKIYFYTGNTSEPDSCIPRVAYGKKFADRMVDYHLCKGAS